MIGSGEIVQAAKWLFTAVKYIYPKYKNRTIVKMVNDKNDPDIDDFVELYTRIIDECSRIEPDEIIRLIGNHDPELDSFLCDYLFFCKRAGQLNGFLKVIYSHNTGYLYVAYLGFDRLEKYSARDPGEALFSSLLHFIETKLTSCKAILFEVDRSYGPGKRNSRVRHFKATAARLGHKAYELGFEFRQPEMPGEHGSLCSRHTILLFIPYNYWEVPDTLGLRSELSKTEVMSFIEFIYGGIYGRVYNDDAELNRLYKDDLNNLVVEYKNSLPDKIPIFD